MFHRYHEAKPQENEMMHTGDESRSSTPGNSTLDPRSGNFVSSSQNSPLMSQHVSVSSAYPSTSSPSPIMTASPAMYYGSKYLPSTPPEAHSRYTSSDSFRVVSDAALVEQERYIVDSNRMSVDPYRQLVHGSESHSSRLNSEVQRSRVEEQINESYHRPLEDIYNSPVDLQRVPETNSQQLLTAQRLVSELQRMHADGLRAASSADISQRPDHLTSSISPTESTSSYRSSLNESVRPPSEPNYRIGQESMLRTHSDPQRLVQESFKEFFPPESPKPTIDSIERTIENDRYLLAENIRAESQRFANNLSIQRSIESDSGRSDINEQQHILPENLRMGNETPHNGLPENLRIETENVQGMMAENLRIGAGTPQSHENIRIQNTHDSMSDNLRLRIGGSQSMIIENSRLGRTDTRHILVPENLRLSSDVSHTINSIRGDSNLVSHVNIAENLLNSVNGTHLMPENLRNETHHSMISDNMRIETGTPHSETSAMLPENLRASVSHSMMASHLRLESDNCRAAIAENLRLGSDGQHILLPENLRVTPDTAARMVPENLCLTEPSQQAMPENLHVINGGILSMNHQNGRMITTHNQNSEPIMRSHYDHRIMTENSHSLRVQSPHYSDIYRNDLQSSLNNGNGSAPTPAPSVSLQMGDLASNSTPQYYSSSSYSSVHNNHYSNYMSDDLDERDLRNGMSLEEKINRGYHDIKPFDQNYPVSMPLMHMPQDTLPPVQPIIKPPKPKKPKEPKPPRLPVIHKCNECLRLFKNSTQLKNHMWRHTGEKPFTCDECGSKFTQQGNLRAHRRIHTGERPYQCPDCKTCFTQLSTLKTHQKIHSDERPYQCSECDAAFRQIANLKTHQVTHTGERPHQCDLCDKAFTQKSNLKAHKNRVHSGDGRNVPAKRGRKKNPVPIKPFNCLDCGAKFTMISNLKIHAKLHAGNRQYECDYCGAEFAQRSNMKTHIQRMHGKNLTLSGKRKIRCDECPATFRLKRCLKTHKKRRHPIKSLKIKILRESKYLMNSEGGNSTSEVPPEGHHLDDTLDDDEDDEDDDGEEEDGDFDDDDDNEDDESEEEVYESQLLTKNPNNFESREQQQLTTKNRSCSKVHGNQNGHNSASSTSQQHVASDYDFVEDKYPDDLRIRKPSNTVPVNHAMKIKTEPVDENSTNSQHNLDNRINNYNDSDNISTSSKENEADGRVSSTKRWDGRFNIKEELQESKDLPLLSSNTS